MNIGIYIAMALVVVAAIAVASMARRPDTRSSGTAVAPTTDSQLQDWLEDGHPSASAAPSRGIFNNSAAEAEDLRQD